MRKDKTGLRLCDKDTCNESAVHTSIHTTVVAYCDKHVDTLLILAQKLGHPDPSSTIRPLTEAEKYPKE